MAVSTETPPRPSSRRAFPRAGVGFDIAAVIGTGAVALLLALLTGSHHLGGLPTIALGTIAALVLFGACGVALTALLPAAWGSLVPLLALPLGATASALALTALGIVHVPLHVSLWVVLALGLSSIVLVVRRSHGRLSAWRAPGSTRLLLAWAAVLFVLFCVALIPAWRSGAATIYGENPDAHQVVGIAVLFQHVPPTATDVSLPIDTVPPAWRFRYPIFYPLAGVSNLAHLDPIRVFPALAALLVVLAALGFAALAVTCLRAPPRAGPLIAAVVGLAVITLHLAWHPYWNQLWGLAVMPYVLLLGWQALERVDARLGVLWALMTVMLALAYPLALPDPLIILLALAVAYRRRLNVTRLLRSRSWLWGVLALVVLAPAVAGAAYKLAQGISQLVTPNASLWQGDVTTLLPVGRFVGTGGGVLAALAVAAVAVFALRALPRAVAIALGLGILVLVLVDVRVRVASSGAYMDFKQLTFVGTLVLTLAATGVVGMLAGRRLALIALGAVAGLAWVAAAAVQDHREIVATTPQVTSELLDIRSWADRLPAGSSVRVDIPASGTQLWAVYMLGSHPVDATDPVLYTTYAHAPYGLRADYSLSLRFYPLPGPDGRPRRFPLPQFARNPPIDQNDEFALRRIVWPARLAATPQTASDRLVEP